MKKIRLLSVFLVLFAAFVIFAQEVSDTDQEPVQKVSDSDNEITEPAAEVAEHACPVCPVCQTCPTCQACPACPACPVCPECRSLAAGIICFIAGLILAVILFVALNKFRSKKIDEKKQADSSIQEMQLNEEKNEKEHIQQMLRSLEREKGYLEEQIDNVVKTMKRNNEKIYDELSSDARWDNAVDMFVDELVKKEYKDGIKVGINSFSIYFDKFSSAVKYNDSVTALETAEKFIAEYEKLSNEYKEEA